MALYRMHPDRTPSTGWQILSIAGVSFYVEPSFLLFIGIIVLYAIQNHAQFAEAGLLAFIIFFSLLGHEGGHALMARLFGYRDISVSLVMFGGNTHHPPATRGHNLLITLAGPLVTAALAILGYILLFQIPALQGHPASSYLASMILTLNLVWLIFNLLPIYPMDGGQALLYFFSFFTRERNALLSVAVISMVACVGVGYYAWRAGFTMAGFFMIMFFLQNLQILRTLGGR